MCSASFSGPLQFNANANALGFVSWPALIARSENDKYWNFSVLPVYGRASEPDSAGILSSGGSCTSAC